MIIYVSFGGMIATTWVQIIKAFLLIFGATVLSFLVLKEFSFSLTNLLDLAVVAHKSGIEILRPGKLVADQFQQFHKVANSYTRNCWSSPYTYEIFYSS